MNLTVEHNNEVYALLAPINELQESGKTDWFGKETSPLQGSRMHYDKGKTFKTHEHKLNPRIINYTQEAFVVIKGKLQIDIFLKNEIMLDPNIHCWAFPQYAHILLGSLTAGPGDVIFVWKGYHKLSILEDNTVCYEIKAGQFTSVSEDKNFLDV